jgi:hypothetical protein
MLRDVLSRAKFLFSSSAVNALGDLFLFFSRPSNGNQPNIFAAKGIKSEHEYDSQASESGLNRCGLFPGAASGAPSETGLVRPSRDVSRPTPRDPAGRFAPPYEPAGVPDDQPANCSDGRRGPCVFNRINDHLGGTTQYLVPSCSCERPSDCGLTVSCANRLGGAA